MWIYHTCLFNDWVKVKHEDLSSKLYRVRMSRMCAPIVSSHSKTEISYLITQHSPQQKKKPSFQTRTAFLSKTESRHTLLSLATSLMFNRPQLSAYGIISHLHPFYLKHFTVHLQGGCLDLSYLLKGTMVTVHTMTCYIEDLPCAQDCFLINTIWQLKQQIVVLFCRYKDVPFYIA